MSKHETKLDLSFLSTEEARAVQDVLARDKLLKKREEDRLARIQGDGGSDQRWLRGVTGQWFREVQQATRSGHQAHLSLAPKRPETSLRAERLLRRYGDRRDNQGETAAPGGVSLRSRASSLWTFRFLQKGAASRKSKDNSLSFTGSRELASGAGHRADSGAPLTEQVTGEATSAGAGVPFTTVQTLCPGLADGRAAVQSQADSDEGTLNHGPSDPRVELGKPLTRPDQTKWTGYLPVRVQAGPCQADRDGSPRASVTEPLREGTVTDSLRESALTDSSEDLTVIASLRQNTSVTVLHTEQTSAAQRYSKHSKYSLFHLPVATTSSGLKRATSVPSVQLQSDETAHSGPPTDQNHSATMLPPALITVLAPHWTGSLRKHKQGVENQQTVQEVRGRGQEVRHSTPYLFNKHQPSQSFLGNQTVRGQGLLHGPDSQKRRLSAGNGRSLIGWLPERTAPRSLLSASVSLDISGVKLENREKALADAVPALVHPIKGQSKSLDVRHYRRMSHVTRQHPPVARYEENSSPSSFLLSLRGVGSTGPLFSMSGSHPGTPAVRPTGPGDLKGAKSSRERQPRFNGGDGMDRQYYLKSWTLPRRTTLPWREHNQNDAPHGEASLSDHTLADTLNQRDHRLETVSAKANFRNDQKASRTFSVPINCPLLTADTHNNLLVLPSTPASPHSSSDMLNLASKPPSPSGTCITSPLPQRKDSSSMERTIPTDTLMEPMDSHFIVTPRTRIQASEIPERPSSSMESSLTLSSMAVIIPTAPVGTSHVEQSPMTHYPTAETSSTTVVRSSNTVNHSAIHRLMTLTNSTSPLRSSCSLDHSAPHSPMAVTSLTALAGSPHIEDNSVTNRSRAVMSPKSPNEYFQGVGTSKAFGSTDVSNLIRSPQSKNDASIQNPKSEASLILSPWFYNGVEITKGIPTPPTATRPNGVNSSKPENSTESSSPVLLLKPPVNVNTSKIPSLEQPTSATAGLQSHDGVKTKLSHRRDTSCSPTPQSRPVLQTRQIRSVDAPITHPFLRRSGPPGVISPTQSTPHSAPHSVLHGRESPTGPSANERLISWRRKYIDSKNPVWTASEDTNSKMAQKLSSSAQPETNLPHVRQNRQHSHGTGIQAVPMGTTLNSRSPRPHSPLSDAKRKLSSGSMANVATLSDSNNLSETVAVSRSGSKKKPLNVNTPEVKVSEHVSWLNTKATEQFQNADAEGSEFSGKNAIPRTKQSSVAVHMDEAGSHSATLRDKKETATEKTPAKDHWFVGSVQANSHRNQLPLKTKKGQLSPSSSPVEVQFKSPLTEGVRMESKEDHSENKAHVTQSFSSKQFEDNFQSSRKKSRMEAPLTHLSSTGKEDVPRVPKPSNHTNSTGMEMAGVPYGYSQASWLSGERTQSQNVFEPDNLNCISDSLKDKNGNYSHQRSPSSPRKNPGFSLERYTLVPRKSSFSPRSTHFPFDFDSDDADNENISYSKGNSGRKSKRKKTISFSEVNDYQACVDDQDGRASHISKADEMENLFRSRSLKNSHQEIQSNSFSSFSLKVGRSFSVSNVHVTRPSGSPRMATVPRMASVSNLTGVDIPEVGLRQQSRARSCSWDQGSWKLVTTGKDWSRKSPEKPWSMQDDELSLSPPPSPPCSPPRLSRAPSSSPLSSSMSPDSLSPRGCLLTRVYKSSLSDLDESESDTTTDDEYYLSGDKGEKETEL